MLPHCRNRCKKYNLILLLARLAATEMSRDLVIAGYVTSANFSCNRRRNNSARQVARKLNTSHTEAFYFPKWAVLNYLINKKYLLVIAASLVSGWLSCFIKPTHFFAVSCKCVSNLTLKNQLTNPDDVHGYKTTAKRKLNR